MTDDNVRYSIIITAHNAAATIISCLQSLDRQAGIDRLAREIILVDDRSTDGTAAAAEAAGTAGLQVLRIEEKGDESLTSRQMALEAGISSARGKIILTLDADGIASPNWMASMVRPIERNMADAVAGPITFRAGRGRLDGWQTVDAAFYLAFCRVLNLFHLRSGVFFGNFAFRRKLFVDIGGFRRIGFALTEDWAFAGALKTHGGKILYTNSGKVEVAACSSWRALLERARRISAGGLSALSVILGIWMASLPLVTVAAVLLSGVFPKLLAIRFFLGVAFVQTALLGTGCRRFHLQALLYEPMAVAIGVLVMLKLIGDRKVEWGGVIYDR
ncbi:MAG: glycosyltransferase [Deltaproteobacteria bacterium]|nr:glycosyltransferase [Deltaproteobacteria bacterium]